jgi:D-3-phosphoglycerate dehydrogenase / 2-oxoglutarate reductase
MTSDRPVVVALGAVDPTLVNGVLGSGISFLAEPSADDLAVAVGAIARADAVVDNAFFEQAPRLRVVARTGVGVDLVDLAAASARGIPVVITPGSGTRAVAEGVLAFALHLVKRLGPLTRLIRESRWAERDEVAVGDLDGASIGIVGYGRIGCLGPSCHRSSGGIHPCRRRGRRAGARLCRRNSDDPRAGGLPGELRRTHYPRNVARYDS